MKEFSVKIAASLLFYFAPVYELFIVLITFVFCDMVSGIVASGKRGIPRSSRRLRKSVAKLVCYMSAVMLAFMVGNACRTAWLACHRAIAALICTVEFLSIMENFAVITENPVFLKILKLIRGKASQSDNIIREILEEKEIRNEKKIYRQSDKTDTK